MVRYYCLFDNGHRGKVKKARLNPAVLRMTEEGIRRIPFLAGAAGFLIPI
jgi:hypothetical protein